MPWIVSAGLHPSFKKRRMGHLGFLYGKRTNSRRPGHPPRTTSIRSARSRNYASQKVYDTSTKGIECAFTQGGLEFLRDGASFKAAEKNRTFHPKGDKPLADSILARRVEPLFFCCVAPTANSRRLGCASRDNVSLGRRSDCLFPVNLVTALFLACAGCCGDHPGHSCSITPGFDEFSRNPRGSRVVCGGRGMGGPLRRIFGMEVGIKRSNSKSSQISGSLGRDLPPLPKPAAALKFFAHPLALTPSLVYKQ